MKTVYLPVLVSRNSDGMVIARYVFDSEKRALSHAVDMSEALNLKQDTFPSDWMPTARPLELI